MRYLALLLALSLVACDPAAGLPVKEISCAPQNIQYDGTEDTLACESPLGFTATVSADCKKGTYRVADGVSSCVDSLRTQKFVIKPILLSADEAFAKKVACQKYEAKIAKSLADSDTAMTIYPSMFQHTLLTRIFYSVSLNTCLYVSTETTTYGTGGTREVFYELTDALSGELVTSTMGSSDPAAHASINDAETEFNQKLPLYE